MGIIAQEQSFVCNPHYVKYPRPFSHVVLRNRLHGSITLCLLLSCIEAGLTPRYCNHRGIALFAICYVNLGRDVPVSWVRLATAKVADPAMRELHKLLGCSEVAPFFEASCERHKAPAVGKKKASWREVKELREH